MKGKVYRTVVRPAMVYCLEMVALTKRREAESKVLELKMLRLSFSPGRGLEVRIRGRAQVELESFCVHLFFLWVRRLPPTD